MKLIDEKTVSLSFRLKKKVFFYIFFIFKKALSINHILKQTDEHCLALFLLKHLLKSQRYS